MPRRRVPPPAHRVRQALAREAGADVAGLLPSGYQRLGDVLVLRLPPALRPWEGRVGELYQRELGVRAVVVHDHGPQGEFRDPGGRLVLGDSSRTEVREEGLRFRLDARTIMFAQGNRRERQRLLPEVRPGEAVADLFAGIGYFSVPLARRAPVAELWAVEKNPASFAFLEENLALNGAQARVRARCGDNREVELPVAHFHRVLLGLLPSGLPFLPRALEVLRPDGGWVHAHLVAGVRDRDAEALGAFRRAAASSGAEVLGARVHPVKPYGPGREHVVVDAHVRRAPG